MRIGTSVRLAGALGAGLIGAAAIAGPAAAAGAPAFTNFELSATPGVACPGSSACFNGAAEPAIRSAPDGTFYASSENGLGAGTDAFRSVDGGRHYTTLPSPNAISTTAQTGIAPGGGDTDTAVAPQKNAAGQYNVYVASLNLANVDVSTSADGGRSWRLNPLSATIPVDDREWVAADGASKVCVSYHDVATFNINVNCSADAGLTFTQLGDAIDAQHLYLVNNNEIGNLAIDAASHTVYQTFSGIASAGEVVGSQAGTTGYHAVWMGVSQDGGRTFSDHPVYVSPDTQTSYGHQFVNVSVDRAGNVYSVFSDNHNVFLSYSTDQGRTWSKPLQVNSGPAATAIFPWSTAGDPGKIDVVYYGTPYYDGTSPPDAYPASASWRAYFAQDLNVLGGGGFAQSAATPVVHRGAVCEGGIGCTGNRDLYDDFGVAASPVTGLASIVYSDDQYIGDAASPAAPGCTPATSNSSSCDHTAIATQTGGPGIFGPVHGHR